MMTDFIFYANDNITQLLIDGLQAEKSYAQWIIPSSPKECVDAVFNNPNAVLVYQLCSPAWEAQNLVHQIDQLGIYPQLFFFEELPKCHIDYYTTALSEFPSLREFETIFKRVLHAAGYSSEHRLRRYEAMGETDAEFGRRVGPEIALIEMLRGCTQTEFLYLRDKYQLDLRENGYYLYFYETQYEEYLDHAYNKDVYNFIGMRLQQDCLKVLADFAGGECFDIGPNLQCIIINCPGYHSEAEKQAKFDNLIKRLIGVTNCKSSARYLSSRLENSIEFRSVFDIFRSRKSSFFFQQTGYVQLSDWNRSLLEDGFESAQQLVQKICNTIKYNVTSPELTNQLHQLFYDIIKPSYSFSLFYYCTALISYSLQTELGYLSNQMLKSLDPQKICYSNIDAQYELLLEQITDLRRKYTNKRQSKNAYVLKTIEYISEHYSEDVTVDDIAKLLHIDSTYLSKVFKAQTGVGLITYLTTYRIDMAKKLLDETDHMIYMIAEKVGFHDGRYFSRVFNKSTGMTPKEYRKACRHIPI